MAKALQAAKRKTQKRAANMVVMAEHRVFTRSFDTLFAAGMALADKVSRYFNTMDSSRRHGSEADCVAAALFYERERKRLGASVLQMAAWLWLERALREGDMPAEKVAAEKKKLVFAAKPAGIGFAPAAAEYEAHFARLPAAYRHLALEVEHFIGRIRHMDKEARAAALPPPENGNPVSGQWRQLHHAFSGKK